MSHITKESMIKSHKWEAFTLGTLSRSSLESIGPNKETKVGSTSGSCVHQANPKPDKYQQENKVVTTVIHIVLPQEKKNKNKKFP